jgi:hypothetical protein
MLMTVKTDQPDSTSAPSGPTQSAAPKKAFVEPAISQPADVLEATTFFQVADSGGTGLRKKGGG